MNLQRCKDAGFLLSRKISAVTPQLALEKPKFTNPSQPSSGIRIAQRQRGCSLRLQARALARKNRNNRGAYGAFRNKPTSLNPATLNPTAKG
jgi:hypothetical protein